MTVRARASCSTGEELGTCLEVFVVDANGGKIYSATSIDETPTTNPHGSKEE